MAAPAAAASRPKQNSQNSRAISPSQTWTIWGALLQAYPWEPVPHQANARCHAVHRANLVKEAASKPTSRDDKLRSGNVWASSTPRHRIGAFDLVFEIRLISFSQLNLAFSLGNVRPQASNLIGKPGHISGLPTLRFQAAELPFLGSQSLAEPSFMLYPRAELGFRSSNFLKYVLTTRRLSNIIKSHYCISYF